MITDDRNPISYSIYRSFVMRLGLHLVFWLLLFIFFTYTESRLFNAKITDKPVLVFGLYCIPCVIMVSHYLLVSIGYDSVRGKNWPRIILCLAIVYLLSLSSIPFLKILARIYPDFSVIKRHYEFRQIKHVADLFSEESFAWFFNIIFIYIIISVSCFVIKRFFEGQQDKVLLLREKNKMELSFLRSQIQPHFLFNTLNNIYGEVIDNERASQSILKLSDLLRFSLYESGKGHVPLKSEIKFLTDYISLEKIRHKESKASIQHDFDDILHPDLEISPLILVNFMENAFKHGVNASVNYSWVNIILKEKDNIVTFKVTNSIGNTSRQKEMGGLGLKNVRRRLELEYPERYDLTIKETVDCYDVVLTLKPNVS